MPDLPAMFRAMWAGSVTPGTAPPPVGESVGDTCEYQAPCPACGALASWRAERLDSRSRTVLLECPGCALSVILPGQYQRGTA